MCLRRLQGVAAHRTVAGAELVGLQGVEDTQGVLRIAADVEVGDVDVLHDVVRVDHQGRAERDAVVLGGSVDNEHSKLGWRREHPDLHNLPIWNFADSSGKFASALGVLNDEGGVAYRATFVVDPDNVIQHVYVTNLNVGRNPQDTLRVLDALQTDELCPCNRAVGGDTLKAA